MLENESQIADEEPLRPDKETASAFVTTATALMAALALFLVSLFLMDPSNFFASTPEQPQPEEPVQAKLEPAQNFNMRPEETQPKAESYRAAKSRHLYSDTYPFRYTTATAWPDGKYLTVPGTDTTQVLKNPRLVIDTE